jgi:hypothetical protein
MIKLLSSVVIVMCIWSFFGVAFTRADEPVQPVIGSLKLTASAGKMIHDASYLPRPSYWPSEWPWDGTGLNNDASYRYGPALIRYGEDNLHFWACSEGDADVADYIRYNHSSDGGKTWSDEVIALAPTVGSKDGWAICDPNVIKLDNYYYMAYTATNNSFGAGLNNQIFIARSLRPDGGFAKWNGSSWGGNPEPIVSYSGPVNNWGMGEPSMVVKGNTLFFYYTEDQGVAKTRVATVSIISEVWPAQLEDRGYAIQFRNWAEDQTEVKYLPEIDRFIATAIGSRFTSQSYVHVWESEDGLTFIPTDTEIVTANIQPFAHNMGMSGDSLGHAKMGAKEFIAYAYTGFDGDWGRWNTWLSKASIAADGWEAAPEASYLTLAPIMMLLLNN